MSHQCPTCHRSFKYFDEFHNILILNVTLLPLPSYVLGTDRQFQNINDLPPTVREKLELGKHIPIGDNVYFLHKNNALSIVNNTINELKKNCDDLKKDFDFLKEQVGQVVDAQKLPFELHPPNNFSKLHAVLDDTYQDINGNFQAKLFICKEGPMVCSWEYVHVFALMLFKLPSQK